MYIPITYPATYLPIYPPLIGRDDFNFLSWILLASSRIPPDREKHFGLLWFCCESSPIPPTSATHVTELCQIVQKQVFRFPAAHIWSDAHHIHPNLLSYQEKQYG